MPPFLLGLLGLPKWAYWLIGAVALVGAAALALHIHDNHVREADRFAAQALAAKAALDAERAANAADAQRQGEIQANDATTRKAIDDATAKDPEKAHSAAGPASRAAADSLRRRKAGSHSPAG